MLHFSPTAGFSAATTLVITFVVVVSLALAETLFVPLVAAFLLGILLHIPLRALQRLGVPRWAGGLMLVTIIAAAIWALSSLIAEPLQRFAADYRSIFMELRERIFSLRVSFREVGEVGAALAEVSDEVADSLGDPAVQQVAVRESNFLVRAASSVAASLTTLITTLIICAFVLATRNPFVTFATMFFEDRARKLRAARMWRAVEDQVSYFFVVTTCINTGLGLTVGLSLYAMGVPLAAFWGVLVGLLNFMPFVGPTIGAVSLFAFCLLQYTSPAMIFGPAAVYLAINFVEANFITPMLVGRRAHVPALALILSLFFWGWLWGFVGLLIAIPFVVIVKALSSNMTASNRIARILKPRSSQ
ncbi:MAG: AI-2E family transporter [Pseudomonadota bacterium]